MGGGASIMALISELNVAGATIIMITHDAGLADRLPRQIRMLDGQVVGDTGPDRPLGAHGRCGGDVTGAMTATGERLRLNDGLRVASVGLRSRPLRAALSAPSVRRRGRSGPSS